ncbi:hypothetical protein OsJ_01660 [Oryza sativa Japonica Group]|uniref:DUF4220 domain-containing protein n=1 Tax=Oryza sativa subsp. japonica TaxID=39947 RepID=B9EWB1_ORYSJ|nr:hypothetical protein OsJ_01660 [Oryza sativa Japonica Group]
MSSTTCGFRSNDLIERINKDVLTTNALFVANAFLVVILVGAGSYGRRYRHIALNRYLFLGASTLVLPILSYVVSYVGRDKYYNLFHGLECVDNRAFCLLLWAALLPMVGMNTSSILTAVHNGNEELPDIIISTLLGLGFIKIILKFVAYGRARRSFAMGQNPSLIAGYMEELYRLQVSEVAEVTIQRLLALVVMGEDKQQIEKGPHGYHFKRSTFSQNGTSAMTSNGNLVTIDKVWHLAEMNDALLGPRPALKHLCMSFSLFKLLRRRFARYPLVEAGSEKAFHFVRGILLTDGADADPEAVFRVITDELSFAWDFYYSSHPISHLEYKDYRVMSCELTCGEQDNDRFHDIGSILCKLMNYWGDKMGMTSLLDPCKRKGHIRHLFRLSKAMKPTKIPKPVKAALINSLKGSNGQLSNGIASLQKCHLRDDIRWACNGEGTSDIILVWHIATCIFEIRHMHDPSERHSSPDENDDMITAIHLSKYCAYLLASCPELLPDDTPWSKELYKSAKKITDSVLGSTDMRCFEFDRMMQLLSEKSKSNEVVCKGVQLGKQLVDGIQNENKGWNMLAEFWSEMMLYVAPSDNTKAHAKAIARGGELITILWALLTHAGIIRRPEHDNVV